MGGGGGREGGVEGRVKGEEDMQSAKSDKSCVFRSEEREGEMTGEEEVGGRK